MPMKRPLISVAPLVLALWRRKSSSTCTTTIPVTLQSRSRMSDLAAHHADELVVLQGLANLHLRRHDTTTPRNPVARLRGCPSPLSACQASLFVGEIIVILRTSAEPGLQDFTSTSLVLQVLAAALARAGAGLAVHDVLGQIELLADATCSWRQHCAAFEAKLQDLLGASAAPTDTQRQGSRLLPLLSPRFARRSDEWPGRTKQSMLRAQGVMARS